MNAPLGRTPEKMGRCECRDEGCPAKDRHIVAGEGPRAGEFVPCRAHAVRLVTDGHKFGMNEGRPTIGHKQVRMCEPCAQYHDAKAAAYDTYRASHTERTTEKGGTGMSRRQRLLELAESGRLRDALSRAHPSVDEDVTDLIVDLCLRYAEPRRTKRSTERTRGET